MPYLISGYELIFISDLSAVLFFGEPLAIFGPLMHQSLIINCRRYCIAIQLIFGLKSIQSRTLFNFWVLIKFISDLSAI